MRARTAFVAGALLFATTGPAAADADLQQWNELGVAYDLTRRWSASFDQHLRFDQDVSRVESVMPELGLDRRVRKWLRLGAGYRLQYTRDGDGELRVRHRVHVDARLRRDVGEVRFGYRLRYQEQLRPGANDRVRHTVRNRVEAEYRAWKPWIPSAAIEPYLAIGDGDPVQLDKLRLTVGAAHDRKKRTFGLFYRIEIPLADEMDPTLHIIGLDAGFDL